MRDLELLAPARTADIGIAAIGCGADAVYIAGPAFGARQAAGNSVSDIGRLCVHAHRFGARIFATLNTIIYDTELEQAYRMMEELQDAGVDAIIIQDMALSPAGLQLSGAVPGLKIPLHASTQCAIRTPEKAKFLERLGFSRLILERELSLRQIREIRNAVGCELEFFVHGALCVCYSGQCYISEAIAGRSANRGACIQACRSRYDLTDETGRVLVKDKPLLSLKDYNLKQRLEALAGAGIASFKIEGRLKNASYVKNIVRVYSLALDALIEAHPDLYRRASAGKVSGGFTPAPEKTFNRGYTELFLDERRGPWASPEAATSMGEAVGRAVRVAGDGSSFSVRPVREGLRLGNGDGLCFVNGRNEVVGFRADVCDGFHVRCKPVAGLADGIMLYRNMDMAFERELENDMPARQVTVELTVRIEHGTLAVTAETEDGRICRKSVGEGCETARNAGNMKKTIMTQLCKTSGIYVFNVKPFEAESLPFLPVSAVNALRRSLAETLDSMPCHTRPLYHGKVEPDIMTSGPLSGTYVTYKDNIANHAAGNLMKALGASETEPAYELSRKPDAELMRTRYCIRYQWGRCPKVHKQSWPARLFLENNGSRFSLEFDCRRCEMIVKH